MDHLSDDILLLFLDFLDIQIVLVCREVCVRLRGLVDSSTLMKLRIELLAENMNDAISSHVPLNQCLARLLEYRRRWHCAKWSAQCSIAYPLVHPAEDSATHNQCTKVAAGTLIAYSCSSTYVYLAQLPSKLRGVPFREWQLAIPGIQKLAHLSIDPFQNLLVSLEVDDGLDRDARLNFRSLTDGARHPRAGNVCPDDIPPRTLKAAFMVVQHDQIAFFRPDEPRMNPSTRIMVWNWTTGKKSLDIMTPGGPGGSGGFLSDRYILIGEVTKDPHAAYLNVIDTENADVPVVCKFQLPTLAKFERSYIAISTSHVSPAANYAEHSLFTTDPKDKVVFVSLLVKEILGLFVLASRLVKLAEARRGQSIQWEDWGPANARLINFDYEDVNPLTGAQVEVSGMRALLIQRNKLTLYDFNQRLVKRDVAIDPKIVTHPTCSSDWKSFKQDVITCLPYRSVVLEDFKDRQWKQVHFSDDGIVVQPKSDGTRCGLEYFTV